MNEPKVHLLKSGMIADKVIIILLLVGIIILSLYIGFFINKKIDCSQVGTNVFETTKIIDYTTKKNK